MVSRVRDISCHTVGSAHPHTMLSSLMLRISSGVRGIAPGIVARPYHRQPRVPTCRRIPRRATQEFPFVMRRHGRNGQGSYMRCACSTHATGEGKRVGSRTGRTLASVSATHVHARLPNLLILSQDAPFFILCMLGTVRAVSRHKRHGVVVSVGAATVAPGVVLRKAKGVALFLLNLK